MVNQDQIEYAMIKFIKTFEQYQYQNIEINSLSDGWAFATILRTASHFKLSMNDLIENAEKWTFKLSNLKKIMNAIQQYFETEINKIIQTKDIDLVEIAKNNNTEQIGKFFELIIGVITEAPNKQDHIGTIMTLDERTQAIFVKIIQKLLETRILDSKQEQKYEAITQVQMLNNQLQTQVQLILNQNLQLEKQIRELELKNQDYEEEIQRLKHKEDSSQINQQQPREKQHLRNMVENLKEKLYHTIRQNQEKIVAFKQVIMNLEGKLIRFDEIEEQLIKYKKKYSQTIQSYGMAKSWEREKIRLSRVIQQKEDSIRKLQERLDDNSQLNYSMQEQQVYFKMELQKRDVRFKQLERQVKKKFESSAPTSFSDNSISMNTSSFCSSNMAILGHQLNQMQQQQMQQMRKQSDRNKRKVREIERQNNKLKRNIDKMFTIEGQKKKLQKLILNVHQDRLDQLSLLVQAMHELYEENQEMRAQITKNNQ